MIKDLKFRKLVLVTFIAICLTSYVKANVLSDLIDDGLYAAINSIIDVKYDNKPKNERECIKKKLRDDRFGDRFTASLKFDHRALQAEMDKWNGDLDKVAVFCEWFEFAKTPLGICLLVGIFLSLLSLIICICKCICC